MKKFFLATPSVLASLVATTPVLTCPACWPLYAGVLSSMGINFINYTPYIFPVTIVMLIISLFSMVWKAKLRHGFGPVILGSAASALLLIGKFYIDNNVLFYGGTFLLIMASIWNVWPKKECPACG